MTQDGLLDARGRLSDMGLHQPSPRGDGVRVGILSASLGYVPQAAHLPTKPLLDDAASRNTGNLVFRYAVAEHIESVKVHVPWVADAGWVRETCDLLVIPSSNQVHPEMDFSKRAAFIESVDLPCVVVGLGAQSPSIGTEISVPAGTRRYLQALSARCRTIGVRGSYTADVLATLGIRNTTVVGCPSHFINSSAKLGSTVEEQLKQPVTDRLVVTAGDLDPRHAALERKLFGWLVGREGAYVCQSGILVALARQRLEEISDDEWDDIVRTLPPLAPQSRARATALPLVSQRFRVFFDVREWMPFLATHALSIGTRIHGNLLAIQAGIPAICIVHDSRTQELCETTAIPHLTERDVLGVDRLEDLIDLARFDAGKFDERRRHLAAAYKALFGDCGIQVSEGLGRLSETNRTES